MKISIINNKNEIFDLYNYRFLIDIDDIKFNKKQETNIETEKSFITGNKNLESERKIKIKLHLAKKTESEFLNFINYLYNFFYKDNAPFYYRDEDNNRFCEIDLLEIKKIISEGTEFFYSTIEINFAMIDNLFEDIDFTEIIQNFTNTNTVSLNINNIKSNIIYPVIEFQCDQSVTNINITSNKEFININLSNYAPNNILVIDSRNNQIYINKNTYNIDIINSVLAGGYLLLRKGDNKIDLNFDINSTGYVKIKYKERYIL